MDCFTGKERLISLFSKYKYVGLILMLGIILMCIPTRTDISTQEDMSQEQRVTPLAVQLEDILQQMEGVGRVQVLLTEEIPEEIQYQVDEDYRGDGSGSRDTVIISGSSRDEAGLVTSVKPPVYRGAVVVCQGADRPGVQLAVIQAVSVVTGISSDRITVLKMK